MLMRIKELLQNKGLNFLGIFRADWWGGDEAHSSSYVTNRRHLRQPKEPKKSIGYFVTVPKR